MNELIDLVQRVHSIVDESKYDIEGVHISDQQLRVDISALYFLSEFDSYDFRNRDSENFPYGLSTEIDGVKFDTIMSAADVADLEKTMPEQFAFISKEIQRDETP